MIESRLSGVNWPHVEAELDARGPVLTPPFSAR